MNIIKRIKQWFCKHDYAVFSTGEIEETNFSAYGFRGIRKYIACRKCAHIKSTYLDMN